VKRNALLFVAAILAALAPAASWATSCGVRPFPYAVWPDAASLLPLNPVLIITVSPTGTDFGPHLIGPHGRVRLKRVEMAGLGPLLGAFAPRESLEPDQRYELHFRHGPGLACNEASWMTGAAPDSLPPVWRAPPSIEYAGSSMNFNRESSDVFVRIPALDEGGALAILVELRSDPTTPVGVAAPQVVVRQVAAASGFVDPVLVLESHDCSQLQFRSGQVFETRLSVIDAAGHVTPSPAGALRFRIPDHRPQPSYEVRTVLPSLPIVLSKPEPGFPAIAKKALIQGVVKGELSIGPTGRVEEVGIIEGLPMGLTEAAVAALETWRFAPAPDGAPGRKVPFQTHFMRTQSEYHPDWNP